MKAESNKPDYKLFIDWFQGHGGKTQKIHFPSYFGPTDCVGIQATSKIKAN